MDALFQVLYRLTTALLIPVVLMLLGLLAWSLFQVGAWLAEWRKRRRTSPRNRWNIASYLPTSLTNDADVSPLLLEVEWQMTCRLSRLRWAVRLGPMLGLMGTLIPMGPALLEFSSGDASAAARQIVIAFATTVVGLLVAGINYTLWQIRRIWYARDLLELEQETCNRERSQVKRHAASDVGSTAAVG